MSRVLVVDDELDVCEYLGTVLKEEGFTIEAVQDPSQVRGALERFRPEAMLVDYRLPGQSGLDLIRAIRREPHWRSLALIMVTGCSGENEKVSALEVGADDYVVKPFSPKELAARLRAVLRRRTERLTCIWRPFVKSFHVMRRAFKRSVAWAIATRRLFLLKWRWGASAPPLAW